MSLFEEITRLDTEATCDASRNIDVQSTAEILDVINREDQKVALAVREEIPHIAAAVDVLVENFKRGGRLFYFGAGTSGRLGVVDAAECPPTFGTDPELVRGIIAGGDAAMFVAQEGAEDDPAGAQKYFDEYRIGKNDTVIGIAASGRTPFVLGALRIAKSLNLNTVMITTVKRAHTAHLAEIADIIIAPYVGAEVVAGSTRMKSGTAQKLVLNMLTTATMVRLGKTYGNIMVDLQLTNLKLHERAKNIIMKIAGTTYDDAASLLRETGGNVKVALVMAIEKVSCTKAREMLEAADGKIRYALKINDLEK